MTGSSEQWRSLLNQVTIRFKSVEELEPLTKEEVQALERQADITLPEGYKEFCRVFGSGAFDVGPYGIAIDCPSPINEQGQPCSKREIIDWTIIDAFKLGTKSIKLLELLDNAYIFGGGQDTIYIFDLRTYSEVDKSCDICVVINYDNIEVKKLGRDFFEFIRDFCIGTKAEEFPDLVKLMTPCDWQGERHSGIFIPPSRRN